MDRENSGKIKKIISIVVSVAIVVGIGVSIYIANSPSHQVQTLTNAQNQLTQISYDGQAGKSALALLEKHAKVTTKHYSFGDEVMSIDGVTGNGPKYWIFYLNGKEASVGAGSYMTKNSDKITWKLQS